MEASEPGPTEEGAAGAAEEAANAHPADRGAKARKPRRLCHFCGRPLQAIGAARANGAPHSEWDGRDLHKRCWKLLQPKRQPKGRWRSFHKGRRRF